MRDIQKIIEAYIESYSNGLAMRYRVCMPDGRGGQLRKQGFEVKELAVEWAMNQFVKRVQNKGEVENSYSTLSFREYGEIWFKEVTSGLAEATKIKYRADLDSRVYGFFGNVKLLDLSKGLAKEFLRELRSDTSINNTTRAMAFTIFKRVVRAAELEDLIPRTGITDLPGPKLNCFTADHWDDSEREHFLTETRHHPQHLLWQFALFSGLRAGEIAALKWECVELIKSPDETTMTCGTLEIRRTRCQKTGMIRETTKTGEHRFVPLFREAAEVLESLPETGIFVFGGDTPMDTKHFARDLRAAAKVVGVKPITFHQLRHSFCSWLENGGLERRVVAELLGHKDLATTNRYSHSSSKTVFLAVERFERARANKIPTTLRAVK